MQGYKKMVGPVEPLEVVVRRMGEERDAGGPEHPQRYLGGDLSSMPGP